MRKRDLNNNNGKAAQTITFDKVVLRAIEEKSRCDGGTVSGLVNNLCKQIILSDEKYFEYLAKFHLTKFHEYNYLKEQERLKKELKR